MPDKQTGWTIALIIVVVILAIIAIFVWQSAPVPTTSPRP